MRTILEDVKGQIERLRAHVSSETHFQKSYRAKVADRTLRDIVRTTDYVRSCWRDATVEYEKDEAADHVRKLTEVQDRLVQFADSAEDDDDTRTADGFSVVMLQVEAALDECRQQVVHNLSDPSVRQQVRALTNGHCTYCDDVLPDNWHIDHVVPKSAGGPDNLANYVPACPSCNISKNGKHVLGFIKKSLGKSSATVLPFPPADPGPAMRPHQFNVRVDDETLRLTRALADKLNASNADIVIMAIAGLAAHMGEDLSDKEGAA